MYHIPRQHLTIGISSSFLVSGETSTFLQEDLRSSCSIRYCGSFTCTSISTTGPSDQWSPLIVPHRPHGMWTLLLWEQWTQEFHQLLTHSYLYAPVYLFSILNPLLFSLYLLMRTSLVYGLWEDWLSSKQSSNLSLALGKDWSSCEDRRNQRSKARKANEQACSVSLYKSIVNRRASRRSFSQNRLPVTTSVVG